MIFRLLLVVVCFFGMFYALFWNINRWTLSGWKLAGTVALCAFVAGIFTIAALAIITTMFG